jgi:hypothetical protein
MPNMVPNDDHPDVYRQTPSGHWLKCVWNQAIQDYICDEIDASEVPRGNFALLHPEGDIHQNLPGLGDKYRS